MCGWILDIQVKTQGDMFISLNYHHLGPIQCKALPGYHALTGCDYTSSCFRKGKVSPLKTAIKCVVHLEGLGNIGEKATFTDNQNLVEKYMCYHGQGSLLSVKCKS